jgi:hypothetical protein
MLSGWLGLRLPVGGLGLIGCACRGSFFAEAQLLSSAASGWTGFCVDQLGLDPATVIRTLGGETIQFFLTRLQLKTYDHRS